MSAIENKGMPVALDCERLILGSALMDVEMFHDIRPVLTVDDFSTQEHKHLWELLAALYDAGRGTDRIMVYQESEKRGFGLTLSFLADLDTGMPRLPSLSDYVRAVKDKTLLRRILYACRNVASRCLDGSDAPQAILESFGQLAVDLVPRDAGGGLQSAGELIDEIGLQNLMASRKERGLMFPWPWMNRWTCGMLPAELWVLAGHTSTGKTSAMLQHAVHASMNGNGVAIFSLEVGKQALFQKACYQLARVDSEKIKQGSTLTHEEVLAIRHAGNELHDMPLYFDTTASTLPAIHAAVRRRRIKSRVDHVIVDYLQLLGNSGRHDTRAQAVGANAWGLKMLATDFQIPVLLLSQFSRPQAGTKRKPELSDLKESGDIENHANGVWFLNRDNLEDSDEVAIDFSLPKQRDGRRNISTDMLFMPKYQRFEERAR